MISQEALTKIVELNKQYKANWIKEVDYSIVPKGCSQEKLVEVLERIVNTGESLWVGYTKLFL